MTPIESTAQILAYKLLNRVTRKIWIDWAYDMLLSGFETEYILILAGMEEPLGYFEMRTLTDKVLSELNLSYTDENKLMAEYTSYLAKKGIAGEMDSFTILNELKDIYIEMDYYEPLQHFYMLYFAKEDLITCEDQWYVNGVNRSNIDQVIIDYFKEWTSS